MLSAVSRQLIIDHSAKAGAGAADAERLHRIDEQVVRDEVLRAGFRFVAEDRFLRNPDDPREWNADSGGADAGPLRPRVRRASREPAAHVRIDVQAAP